MTQVRDYLGKPKHLLMMGLSSRNIKYKAFISVS